MIMLLEEILEVSWATRLLKVTKTRLAVVSTSQGFRASGNEELRASLGIRVQCHPTQPAEMFFLTGHFETPSL